MNLQNISELTIYEVEKMKPLLLEELKKEGDIELDMATIEKIDMVGVQLILSFMKSAQVVEKKVKLKNIDEAVRKQLKSCEFAHILGTSDE